MSVEVVHHDHNFLCQGIVVIRKFLHGNRPIFSRTLIGDFDKSLSHQRLKEHKQIGYTFPFVLIIDPLRLSRLSRQGFIYIREQLFAGLIHAYQGILGIMRTGINLQDIFHITDKSSIGLRRNAIFFFQPRLKFFFLSVVRMVSCEMLLTISNLTHRSCSNRNDQRSYPSGAAPQASAIKWASAFPSRLRAYSRSGFLRSRVCSNPLSVNALRILVTVMEFTSKASQIVSYDQFGPPSLQSDFSKILARVNFLAGAVPEEINFSRC